MALMHSTPASKLKQLFPVPLEKQKRVEQEEEIVHELKTEFGMPPVKVRAVLMEERKENFRFNSRGDVSGWDQKNTYKVEVKNFRALPVKVEIKRNFPHQYWGVENEGECGKYEKEDLDTVKYTLQVEPSGTKTFTYTLTLREGERRNER